MTKKFNNPKKDALEAFIHTFMGDPELEYRFMGLIDDYARSYHLQESKLLINRMNDIGMFKDNFEIDIDDNSNRLLLKDDSVEN